MIRKHAIVIALTFLFLGFLFTPVDTPFVHPNNIGSEIQETPENIEQVADGPVPQEPLRLNVIENPSYEDWNDGSHSPEGWLTQSSAHQYSDRAYTSDVANGVYAGYIEGLGGNVSYANSYLIARPRAPITEALIEPGISLSFNWKVQSLPDLQIGSEVYLYIQTRDGFGGSHYFFYYLSTASTYTTASIYARISVNDTIGQWNSFNRNITEDFIDEFGGGALTSTYYIDYLWFYVTSPAEATGMAAAVIDDVILYNTTYTDWIENGDFESGAGSPWTYYYTSLGYVQQSTDSIMGSYSTKVTVPSVTGGSGWARCYMNFGSTNTYHAVSPGMTVIEIDWNYNDTFGIGASQYAYMRITYENGSVYQVHYYFGRGGDTIPSNNTPNYYAKIPGFGARESWQHSQIDLYDAASQLGLFNLSITGISFYSYAGSVTGSAELLIDDFKMTTYPASDPTFEYDNIVGTDPPFLGWKRQVSPHGELTKTTDSHTGFYACNLTTNDNSDGIYRGGLYVDIDGNLATDFWWKLDHIDSSNSAYAYIDIEFYDLSLFYHIIYIVGRSSSWTPTNSATIKYIEADGFNQTGIWTNLNRNITYDFESSFSISSEGWALTGIELHVYSAPGLKVSCLFDDIHFIDTGPPVISSVDDLANPMYYEDVPVSITVNDVRPGVSSVVVNYTTDGWSSWNTIATTYSTSTYDADIPAQPYDTLVQYYVIATDGCGVQAINDNLGAYYSYTVDDDIAPILTIDTPLNNTDQEGLITITVTVDDPGSGIEWVKFNADGSGAITDYDIPYQQNWNMDDESLGSHFVIVTVRDNAGLETTKTHYFTVVDTTNPVLDSPSDIEYALGDTGNEIDWAPTDVRPSSYEVFIDDVSTFTGSWNDTSEHIILDVDGLAIGSYNYTCVVYDEAGNSVSDTVIVNVVAQPTSPTTSGTGPPADLTPLLIVVVVGAVGILLVVFVIMPKMKKS